MTKDKKAKDQRANLLGAVATESRMSLSIEQDNSNIRHFLARFRRRTKVVSKDVEMVDLSLRIYHHFHDNPRNFAALAATFLCIFS